MSKNGKLLRQLLTVGLLAGLGPGAAACGIDTRQVGTQEESSGGDTSVTREIAEAQPGSSGSVNALEDGASTALPRGEPVSDGTGGTPNIGAVNYRLSVKRSGPESGRVTSSVPGIDCGTVCTGLFSGPVALSARTRDGDEAYFTGWSNSVPESACAGAKHDCSLLMDHDQTLTANFATMVNNLIFVSSKAYPPTLGGVVAYDAECNALASAAGINDAAGSAYIALMSDFGDDARPIGDPRTHRRGPRLGAQGRLARCGRRGGARRPR